MDQYENEELRQEPAAQEYGTCEPEQPVYQPISEHQTYHGAGAGRKESPFANSPYVMNQDQPAADYRNQNTYIPPEPPRKPPCKPKKEKKHGNGRAWKAALCTVLALAVVVGSCSVTASVLNRKWASITETMLESFENRMTEMQAQIDAASSKKQEITTYPEVSYVSTPGAVYQQNVDSVVLITAKVKSTMFGQTTTGMSSGSGFIMTEDGYVVTNHHVIDGASEVTVTTFDGTEYPAKIIGSDSTNDVALLKIEETVTLPAVTIGSSDALHVGDQVVAIGNPLGELTSTLTVGYVSAKERNVTTDGTTINMIQTDAAINSGNSGGPLFNMNGEVVGITTAKYSGSSSSGASIEGIGFAIPIDDVKPLVEDLMNYGYINSAYLGVMVREMDTTTAFYYSLPVGAYVQEVTPGYCAEEAGLKAKDIIIGLGSYKIESISDLTKALRKFKAGETTQITVYRGGQELSLTITLDEKPRDTSTQIPEIPENGKMPENGSYEDWYNYFFGDKG